MKLIKLSYPHNFKKNEFDEMVLALGYFDGVHKGHQKVILKAKEIADKMGVKSAVMTFNPHPLVVLRKEIGIDYITPLEDKIQTIENLSVDILFIVEFTREFAALLPQQFVDEFIINLNVKHVVAGFDFTYGHLGKGTMETIPFHSREQFLHTTVEKQTDHDRKISSTLIREVIRSGDVAYAQTLIGRPHSTKGRVIHGDKRGRTIGFPTANVEVFDDYIIPPTGVYAVTINIKNQEYEGVCNIGYKPTFHEEKPLKPSVEVHIFNFNDEIYGENVTVFWYKRIRSEQKFHNVEELIEQIKLDKAATIQFFEKKLV
ncbi:riboflavin kinase/FMN adenylyltransferase [Metabacillus crassostreae]|uniref:bifunctional riboflavin kinase/FAD synthetase n=1 Tax=Metabacillus crassostreae TaxID=929098 RepID=UPI00195AD2B7|nr:bifunctional riboflavin kinase/FAD synthetase [Metabacillus crassostreae]MBM7603277.1 riboflavin kinase/FMN adenylyltransferase [Metabacillus crassostreae]